jgi:hypothetical protein
VLSVSRSEVEAGSIGLKAWGLLRCQGYREGICQQARVVLRHEDEFPQALMPGHVDGIVSDAVCYDLAEEAMVGIIVCSL